MSGGATARLAFTGVRLSRGSAAILDGVDLALQAGEVLGLVGRNGAGKTTLLRLASGVERPDAGEIRIDGEPVGRFGRRALARRVAVVPQDTVIPFAFRVFEVVLMGRAPHLGALGFESADDLARAHAALAEVGIAGLAERSVLTLSGGERQLVVLARALAQDAPILLLDEATAFLDLRHRVHALALARRHAARDGRATLVVSHDLGLAARSCDRLALLAEGRIVALGTPAEVLTPARIERVFGLAAQVVAGPDGSPLVVPEAGR